MKVPFLLAGLVALAMAAAGPAAADTGRITSPGNGTAYVGNGIVAIRATVDAPASGSTDLRLQGPLDRSARVVATQSSPAGGDFGYDFDTGCSTYPSSSCRGHVPAANGSWTVTLAGSVTDRRTFTLRIPPAAPDTVAASNTGSGVVVSWRLGDEPDLTSWSVYDGSGHQLRSGVTPAGCQNTRCSTDLGPQPGAQFQVRAYRATCPGCTDTLASDLSATATVGGGSVGTPPGATRGAGGGGASGSPAAQPAGGGPPTPRPTGNWRQEEAQALAQQRADFYRYYHFPGPQPTVPPAASRGATAGEPPVEDGTYSSSLGYQRTPAPQAANVPEPGPQPADRSHLELLAAGLAALVAAGHLRRLARATGSRRQPRPPATR